MKLDVQFDDAKLQVKMDQSAKNVVYSTATALNEVAKASQQAELRRIGQVFQVRSPAFIKRLVKIGKFASARDNRPFVEIFIDPRPLKSQVLLSLFEEGGVKLSRISGGNVAVPITGGAARPAFSMPITAALKFPALRFRQQRTRSAPADASGHHLTGSGMVWTGRLGTFLIPNVGVFQRIGKETKLIYVFKKRVPIPKRLEFKATIDRTFRALYNDSFARIFLLRSKETAP